MKKMSAHIIRMVTSLVLVTFCLLVLTSQLTYAADVPTPTPSCPSDQAMTEVGCLPTDPIQFVTSFYGIGLGLIGGVALVFIIIGGYTLLTSEGKPEKVNVGKSYIFYAVLGLLLAIFGFIFIEVFLVDILQLPGVSH